MSVVQADVVTIESRGYGYASASVVTPLPLRGGAGTAAGTRTERALRCVSTGYSSSSPWPCDCRIPKAAVEQAWREDLDAGGECSDRFFHFIWGGGVWSAYGLQNGRVRGVYCPAHTEERAERSHAACCSRADVDFEVAAAA